MDGGAQKPPDASCRLVAVPVAGGFHYLLSSPVIVKANIFLWLVGLKLHFILMKFSKCNKRVTSMVKGG
ncbi:hypothetical protein PVK06_025341 [Gossypium arboreum]|uniref:Uncharacterized protein n=1 Tax=Gossypium arboreum TaxID=29729 RepID=A0ABR0PGJ1_GOSAR|nr:hypothetical protein PVK06_025341 [Gossypium arboreum]